MDKGKQIELIKKEIENCEEVLFMNKLKERYWTGRLIAGQGSKQDIELMIGKIQTNIKGDNIWQGFLEAELGSFEMNAPAEESK